jgi:hypothetical protein
MSEKKVEVSALELLKAAHKVVMNTTVENPFDSTLAALATIMLAEWEKHRGDNLGETASAQLLALMKSVEQMKGGTGDTAARKASTLPESGRYGIQQGSYGFTDREGVLELTAIDQKFVTEEERKRARRELRLQREKEERRIDFSRDYVVRIVKEEPELNGMCEVIAEDGRGLKNPRFWVHKSVLQTSDSLFGSKIVTGYMVFKGNEGTEVGGADVSDLLDLLVAVYA